MLIEQFDATKDVDRLRACHEIETAGWPTDHLGLPVRSLAAFAADWQDIRVDATRLCWLATDAAGEPAGCYLLVLPRRENLSVAFCAPIVPPSRRRRGLGTTLLTHAAAQAAAAGRTTLIGEAREDTAAERFASATGATGGIEEVIRIMDIGPGLPGLLARLRAEAEPYAAGYELLTWTGATPEQYLEQFARVQEAMADAPIDEGMQPPGRDPDRLRSNEAARLAQGQRRLAVAARHRTSGQLAAATQMHLEPGMPEWAFQGNTAVLAEHRGHRLGLLVKVAMLGLLAEQAPEVRHILTANAASNRHMIAINEQLGYRVNGVYRHWELGLTPDGLPGV